MTCRYSEYLECTHTLCRVDTRPGLPCIAHSPSAVLLRVSSLQRGLVAQPLWVVQIQGCFHRTKVWCEHSNVTNQFAHLGGPVRLLQPACTSGSDCSPNTSSFISSPPTQYPEFTPGPQSTSSPPPVHPKCDSDATSDSCRACMLLLQTGQSTACKYVNAPSCFWADLLGGPLSPHSHESIQPLHKVRALTAVSIAKRGNESSATGPPALPPPPCLWTCFPSYLLPSLAFL